MNPMDSPMCVLVVTIVHNPDDARIRYRQIEALLDRGITVTYAAPFDAFGITGTARAGLTTINLPRATGRRRLGAIRGARKLIKRLASAHDVVLIHDPELLFALPGTGVRNVVWDVHEDTAAAIEAKGWIPKLLRAPIAGAVRSIERRAEKKFPLLLAEYEYQERFKVEHAVIPNTIMPVDVPVPPEREKVVYLGSITRARGADVLCELGQLLTQRADMTVSLHVIGPAWDSESQALMESAHARGNLVWHGFQPQTVALESLNGALAGLSFLQDLPNYRHSMPTKVLEYMGHGVPVISTPLPLPAKLISETECGFTTGFGDAHEALAHIETLFTDLELAAKMGRRGWQAVKASYDWKDGAEVLVRSLEEARERFASGPRSQ